MRLVRFSDSGTCASRAMRIHGKNHLPFCPKRTLCFLFVSVRYRPVDADGEPTMPAYLNWEGKLRIPLSWYNEPVLKLTDYICKIYNERHPELGSVLQLNSSEYFLTKYYRRLGTKEKIKEVIERGGA